MSEMVRLAGLWKKDGKDGAFYQGGLGHGAQVLVFRNKNKRDEKDPDLVLYIAKLERKAEPAA